MNGKFETKLEYFINLANFSEKIDIFSVLNEISKFKIIATRRIMQNTWILHQKIQIRISATLVWLENANTF